MPLEAYRPMILFLAQTKSIIKRAIKTTPDYFLTKVLELFVRVMPRGIHGMKLIWEIIRLPRATAHKLPAIAQQRWVIQQKHTAMPKPLWGVTTPMFRLTARRRGTVMTDFWSLVMARVPAKKF